MSLRALNVYIFEIIVNFLTFCIPNTVNDLFQEKKNLISEESDAFSKIF